MKKRIAILGATGSIGTTTFNIVRNNPNDFEIVLLANSNKLPELKSLMEEFRPKIAICSNKDFYYNNGKEYAYDKDYLAQPETYAECQLVINGIAGISGLKPTLAVIKAGKVLATANKESFVTAGNLIVAEKNKYNATIIPLDSEHSTVWQCIGQDSEYVESIILTASGGAFRDLSYPQLLVAKAKDALKHPTWVMGKKITIDCATLMNKGMEIIEAKYLFGVDKIEVVQHKQSIIHSMVQFKDNFIRAGLSYPDMTQPIQLAMYYPQRKPTNMPALDFEKVKQLDFGKINEKLFPCFSIAKRVNQLGDIAGVIMNSANDVACDAYLKDDIGFYDIPDLIDNALQKYAKNGNYDSIEDIFCMNNRVSEYTFKRIYGGY